MIHSLVTPPGGRRACRAAAPSRLRRRAHVAAALAMIASTAGFADGPGGVPVPSAPDQPTASLPKASDQSPTQHSFQLPDNWQELARSLTLSDIVDIALANNEDTRGAWFAARSAAADLGSKRSELYPTADLTADLTRVKVSAVGGRFQFLQSTYGPAISLNYLLFDFGGRGGRIDQAKSALLAADWQHNAAIQNVVLQVQQAYYSYLDTKAQLEAADATLSEAKTNLDAANERHSAGVATIADVLQAKTVVSRALLTRQQLAGDLETLRGALATSMGVPANTPFDVGTLPDAVPVTTVTTTIEPLLQQALANRPDLEALRWQAEKAAAKVRDIRSEGLPSINAQASASRVYYLPSSLSDPSDNWSIGLAVKVPLFAGFKHSYDLRKAEADLAVSRSQASKYEQNVILDVWAAFAGLKTAAQQVSTSQDFLASAKESEQVALGRYKEGVGSIIDLLLAQTTLSSARAQEIQARTQWLLAVATLAHATGSLGPAPTPHPSAAPGPVTTQEKQP